MPNVLAHGRAAVGASVCSDELGGTSSDADHANSLIHSFNLKLETAIGTEDQYLWPIFVRIGVGVSALLPNLTIGELKNGFAFPTAKATSAKTL